MNRRLLFAFVCVVESLGAQAADTRPAFEAATIKPSGECGNGRGSRGGPAGPGRLSMRCQTLSDLIQSAFGTIAKGANPYMKYLQIIGGPKWLGSDQYDIDAKAAGAADREEMRGPMMQALPADRFRLKMHRESRDVPVYALTVAKGGTKLPPAKEESCVPRDVEHLPAAGQPMPNFCGFQLPRMSGHDFAIDMSKTSLDEFAEWLSGIMDRGVIDKTGVPGVFDFHLKFAPEGTKLGGPVMAVTPGSPLDVTAASIFTAVQEQLGLKLSPEMSPIEAIIVDQAERPSEN
jgi:uncharacterized protein (TIGR03435 family)